MRGIEQTFVAVERDDGGVSVMGFITHGQGSVLPYGATWSEDEGWWDREPTDLNIFQEISRWPPDEVQPVAFKKMTKEHHAAMNADRSYRNAWEHAGNGVLRHNMPKARELHREKLRRDRVEHFAANDLDLRDAMLNNDKPKIKAGQDRQKYLKDITTDPRIEAAQNIEALKLIKVE